ncbi:MAG: DUF559 domain-containing protein, partial [Actinomycetota bacterium]|nr:DUF559 domain-containing protein [Actinomycetota bacterium]
MLSRIAAESESVVDLPELRSCGFDRHAVAWRERNGRLHRLYAGVYAVGHPNISLKGRFIAAVKASGPGAALSHRSEAARAGFMDWRERDIEVTVPRGRCPENRGIQVHRSCHMTRRDLMVRDGILVTGAPWTIVSLASVLPPDELRDALRVALRTRAVSLPGLLALLDRLGPVRGSRKLRQIVAQALPTRSELEEVVHSLIAAGGFALPEVNEPVNLDGRVIIPDFRWSKEKIILEADGARWHDDALARAADLERQVFLESHGETVLRIRWDEA